MHKYLLSTIIIISINPLFAQNNVDWSNLKFKTDSTSQEVIYKVSTNGGLIIYGELKKVNKGNLHVITKEIGVQEIPIKNITSIVIKGERSSKNNTKEMVGSSHYMISSSPYGLKKKEFNLQSSEILLASAWYGITDRVSVSLGTALNFEDEFIVSFKTKYNYSFAGKLNVAVQYNKYFGGYYSFSYATGMLGYGDSENNISIGYNKGLTINEITIFDYSLDMINISGIKRLSRRFAMMTDNKVIKGTNDNDNFILYGLGGRLFIKSSSFDLGIYATTGFDDEIEGFGFIWVNYTLRIKTN